MSFIVVKYGYKHKMLFSTNVTFAPLIDSMRDGVCKSLNDILTNKEAEFNKKLKELNTVITNDKNAKDKLLHKDGKPGDPDLPETNEGEDEKKEAKGPDAKKETKKGAKGKEVKDAKGKDAKKEDKKETKKEEKKEAKKEEKKEAKKEEKKEAKKEEKKEVKKEEKKEEKKEVKKDAKKETKKEGKKDAKKDGKGGKKGETDEENKLEDDVAKKIEEMDERITKNEADCELAKQKIKAIKEAVQRFKSQEVYPKVIDLVDSNGERKYIKTKKDIYANTYLTDKSGYDIVEVVTNPDGGDQAEEEVKKIEIDGMCVRSIEEEKAFVPEEKVPDKGKGGKGGKDAKGKDAKGKKK